METGLKILLIIGNCIILVFIIGGILVLYYHRKKQLINQQEKLLMEQTYMAELLEKEIEVKKETMEIIGREIHDSVAQKLTIAAIHSSHVALKNTDELLKSKYERVVTLVNDSLLELRDLAHTLTNAGILEKDIKWLIEEECRKISDIDAFEVKYQCDEIGAVSATAKVFILRIIQEFFQNSLKYANCTEIELALKKTAGSLYLYMKDNGVGYDMTVKKTEGIGITNIRHRVNRLQGEMELLSSPGAGTSLKLLFELNKIGV